MDKCLYCHETIWRTTEYVDGIRTKVWMDCFGTNFCPAAENPALDHQPEEDELAVAS